jgi:hypothetical protein
MYITPIQTGDILAKTANNIVDQFKQEAEKQQKRAQLTTSYGTIAEQMGFDKNYVKTLSLEQRMGLVEGRKEQAKLQYQQDMAEVQKRRLALEEEQAPLAREQTQNAIELIKQQREQNNYLQSQQRAQQAFYRDLARYAPVGQLERPLTQEQSQYEMAPGQTAPSVMQMLQSAGRSGYNMPPAVLDDMYRALNPAARQTMFGAQDMGRGVAVRDADGNPVPGMALIPTSQGGAQIVNTRGYPQVTFDPGGPPVTDDNQYWFNQRTGEYRPVKTGDPVQDLLGELIARGAGITNATPTRPQRVPQGTNAPAAAPKPYKVYILKDGKLVPKDEQQPTK